jgi:hypothetical protein
VLNHASYITCSAPQRAKVFSDLIVRQPHDVDILAGGGVLQMEEPTKGVHLGICLEHNLCKNSSWGVLIQTYIVEWPNQTNQPTYHLASLSYLCGDNI